VKPIRLAVIGTGRLGTFHAQKLAAIPNAQLIAVVDPEPEARLRAAELTGAAPLADFRCLLLEGIDAVIIAAPTCLHHRIGIEFLHRGVHVFMEKPLAATVEQAEELLEEARRRSVVLQVGHVERFNPAFRAAKPAVADPLFVHAVRFAPFSFRSMDTGVVMDLMIHDLDLVLHLVNHPIRRVDAVGYALLGDHEDLAHARIEFTTGAVAVLAASRVHHHAIRRAEIYSRTAWAEIDFAGRTAWLTELSDAVRSGAFDVRSLEAEKIAYYREHLFEEHFPRRALEVALADPLTAELTDFLCSIREGRPPEVDGLQGLAAVAAAQKVLQAIRTHGIQQAQPLPASVLEPVRSLLDGEHLSGPHWHLSPDYSPRISDR